MLAFVLGGKSFDSLPETVTRPGLVGCLNCRWLPRIATTAQSSFFRSRIISRTFTCSPPLVAERRLFGLTLEEIDPASSECCHKQVACRALTRVVDEATLRVTRRRPD